uniref:Protocadherin 12 n=1 Tax=Sinocyclocheilus anshuiensis TaxID=1608454 RepID=A0A671SG25_9TELE
NHICPPCHAHNMGSAPLIILYHVWEEQPSGTRVGRLLDDLRERGETGSLENFRVVPHGHTLPVTVDVRDGTVSTLGRLDREELCWGAEFCELAFSVLYRKGGAMHFLSVRVEVMDQNDHSPVFPSLVQEVEISETASLRMHIPLDRAVDPDAGPNGLQTYSLSSNQHFALDIRTSGGAKQAELVVIKELDRELQPTLELVLTAWDKGDPPKSGSTKVIVTILDSNDNSPVFEEAPAVIELAEDTVHGTIVINLCATDPDQGANGEVEYSLSKHVPLEVQRLFSIHPKTGAVTLQGPLDFEENNVYEVDIQARDLGPNAIPSHHNLQVKLRDINDNAPRIHITWTPPDSPVATVSEGAPNETFLTLVMVSDADSGANGQVQVHILSGSGPFRLKQIHGDNYMIVTNDTLDRERQMEYNLTLLAQDRGDPSLSCIKHLTVHVLDENDNAPMFAKSHYRSILKENNTPGLPFLTVEAHDVDMDLSGRVSFSIRESNELGTPTAFFSVHPSSGAVTVQQSLDYEETHSYSFIVEAVDQGYPPMSSTATVLVEIQDVNDNYPVIHENFSSLNKPEGFLATTIRASDPDSGLNGRLSFRITEGKPSNLFFLDKTTGQLYVNTTNATELIGRTFKLGIAVSDMGTPMLTTRITLEVTFINFRDHLKNLSHDNQAQYSYTMLLAICLGSTFLVLFLAIALAKTFCHPDKRDNRAYNCRQAESTYPRPPRRPQKHIHKTDIQLVPVLRGRKETPQEDEAEALSCTSPLVEMLHPQESDHRQILRNLVRLSMAAFAENGSIELSSASPEVQQVSQLLSLLHQGQLQPRPNFRGNKYSHRTGAQDADWLSTKDSGHGESEMGDMDWDSPVDPVYEEGLNNLLTSGKCPYYYSRKL